MFLVFKRELVIDKMLELVFILIIVLLLWSICFKVKRFILVVGWVLVLKVILGFSLIIFLLVLVL